MKKMEREIALNRKSILKLWIHEADKIRKVHTVLYSWIPTYSKTLDALRRRRKYSFSPFING